MSESLEPLRSQCPAPSAKGVRRVVYIGLGLFFVGLGVLGAILPVLPTTPFLLLASFFFVRSSPRLNDWLRRSRLFGPFLRDWQEHRGVRLKVKIVALLMVPTAVFCSAFFGNLSWPLVVMLMGLGLIGMTVVIRLPLIRESSPLAESSEEAASGQASPFAAEPLQSQEA